MVTVLLDNGSSLPRESLMSIKRNAMIYVFNMNNLSALDLRKLTESCSLPAGVSLVFREIFLVVRLRGARLVTRPGLPLRNPPGSIVLFVVVNIRPGVRSGLVLNCKGGDWTVRMETIFGL